VEVLRGQALGFPSAPPLTTHWDHARNLIAQSDSLGLRFLVDGERGDARQVLHDVRRGRAHLAAMPVASLATLVPEFEILLAPYLFGSAAEARFVCNNYLFEVFDRLLATRGLRLLVWQELGWQGLAADSVLYSPAQTFGMRSVHTAKRFESGTGIAGDFGVTGLARRVFFARLGVVSSVPAFRLFPGTSTQIKTVSQSSAAAGNHPFTHFTQTNHLFAMAAVVVNSDWLLSAKDEQQAVLRAAFTLPVRLADRPPGGLSPVSLHELSAADIAIWQRATAPVLPVLVEQIGGDSIAVLGALERGRAAFRSQTMRATTNVDR